MSISAVNKVDAIGTDKVSGQIIMTIADHLDWQDESLHLKTLQAKLNAYIEYILSGQFLEVYPDSKGRKIVIQIISKYSYPEIGFDFLEKVRSVLSAIGIGIAQTQLGKQNDR